MKRESIEGAKGTRCKECIFFNAKKSWCELIKEPTQGVYFFCINGKKKETT